jgi:hypothetical protein
MNVLPQHKKYIEERFARAELSEEPFPHMRVRDVLPPEVYREMEAALPPPAEVKRALLRDRFRRWIKRAWRLPKPDPVYFYISNEAKAGHLDSYAAEWHRRFGGYVGLVERLLHERLRVQQPWHSGQRVFFFRPTGWAIPPHVHPRAELTNTLIYFPSSENTVEQGTLLYRARPGVTLKGESGTAEYGSDQLEPVTIVPYLPNTLVTWINTPGSVHSSIEIAGGAPRRYLYFVSVRAEH